jgi:hypothetical protein
MTTDQPRPPVVLSWGWREQPDMDEFADAIRDLFGGHLYKVDTDDYAIVLSAVELDDAAVTHAWDHRWDGEDS